MITLGNNKIAKMYLGATPVATSYLGSQQVYPNASLALSADLLAFAAAGGSQELTVAVEEGQMWALSVPVGWSASSQSGTGTATLTLTIDNNTTTVARSGALTVVSEDLTATCALAQAAGAKSYGEISIGAYGYGVLPAGGGTVSPTLAYSQPWTWNGVNGSGGTITSGATVAYSGSGVDAATGTVSASTKGTTESGQTTVATATVSVSLNGKSAAKEAVVFQEANSATYGNVTPKNITVADIPASGGTISEGTLATDFTQTISYTSGATRPGAVTYVWGDPVSAPSLGTTIQNRTKIGSLALRAYGEGSKNTYKATDVYQAGNYVSSLAGKASTFSYGTLGAGAASISPTVNADGAWTFTFSSGATSSEAPSSVYGIFSVGVTYSLGSVQNGFTVVDASTGTLTGTARGTEIGNARTSGIVTRKVDGVWTPAAACNAAGTKTTSASKTAACTQEANARALSGLSAGCESSSNMPPDIRQHDWMGAAGGIFTFFCNANYSYTSGATSLEDVRSSTAYTSLGEYAGITINGNTAIIPSRGTVEGSNRYNHFTASYGGKAVSWNTGQAANARNLSSIRIAAYAADATWVQPADWGAVPAGGGYINFRRYTTYLYTSGSTIEEKNGADGDRSGMVLYEGGGWMEAWGNGGYHVMSRGVTAGERRRGTIYWTYDGLTSNHLVLYQDANVLTWNDPVISRATPVSIAAAGGTNNVASGLTYSQGGSYTSGSPASASSGGSLSYAVQTAKTGFSLSGSTVTVTNNTSTSARNGFVVRITLTLNSKTATKDITYNQAAGVQSIEYTDWATTSIDMFASPTTVAAAGGTSQMSTKATQNRTKTTKWNGIVNNTQQEKQTVSVTASYAKVSGGGSLSGAAAVSFPNNTTNAAKSGVYRATYGGKTDDTTIAQAAGTQTIERGAWITQSVQITASSTNVAAAGGSSSLSTKASQTRTVSIKWNGIVTDTQQETQTISITPTYSKQSGGGTLGGSTVSFGNNTTANIVTGVYRATYDGKTSDITINQAAGSKMYQDAKPVMYAIPETLTLAKTSGASGKFKLYMPNKRWTWNGTGTVYRELEIFTLPFAVKMDESIVTGSSKFCTISPSRIMEDGNYGSTEYVEITVTASSANTTETARSSAVGNRSIMLPDRETMVRGTCIVTQQEAGHDPGPGPGPEKASITLSLSYNQSAGTFVISASEAVRDTLRIGVTYHDDMGGGGDTFTTLNNGSTSAQGYAGGPSYPYCEIFEIDMNLTPPYDSGNAIYYW
ncbi:hypothetical protein [Alistipes indistinctus]|jgi:hypothetical protein|uniref:hypothetical protein n=1 Tax=Alistipes indistinctus TaxID=626932 RepID=UPI0026DCE2C3|nr:hypothetical protein [Alistipes indistinctus]